MTEAFGYSDNPLRNKDKKVMMDNYWSGPGLIILLVAFGYGFVIFQIKRVSWRGYLSARCFGYVQTVLAGYFAVGFGKGVIAGLFGAISLLGVAVSLLSPEPPTLPDEISKR